MDRFDRIFFSFLDPVFILLSGIRCVALLYVVSFVQQVPKAFEDFSGNTKIFFFLTNFCTQYLQTFIRIMIYLFVVSKKQPTTTKEFLLIKFFAHKLSFCFCIKKFFFYSFTNPYFTSSAVSS